MWRDCSSHNDYSQELPRFNQKRLEKCSTEKSQPHQPKLVAAETVDPNEHDPKHHKHTRCPNNVFVKYPKKRSSVEIAKAITIFNSCDNFVPD